MPQKACQVLKMLVLSRIVALDFVKGDFQLQKSGFFETIPLEFALTYPSNPTNFLDSKLQVLDFRSLLYIPLHLS